MKWPLKIPLGPEVVQELHEAQGSLESREKAGTLRSGVGKV